MKSALVMSFVAAFAIGGSALAAERAAKPPKADECQTLQAMKDKTEKIMSALEALAKAGGGEMPSGFMPDNFAKLSPAKFHYLEGFYARDPHTPGMLPEGGVDGALLATKKGHDDGQILWTRGELVCGSMSAPKLLIEFLTTGKIKDAPGEEKDGI